MLKSSESDEDFKEIPQFYTFIHKITSPWGGVGDQKIYYLMSPSPTDAMYKIWQRLAQLVVLRMPLTHDKGATHSKSLPYDSGDLKT